MSYIYVSDKAVKNHLLSQQLRLIQELNMGKKTWVFENNPSLFNISEDAEIGNKCVVSDSLMMFF